MNIIATQNYDMFSHIKLQTKQMEQLANLCGGIGKQIDDALSQGEISEQEYKDLNKGLNAYTEFMTKKAETQKATWSVMRQTAAATRKKIESGISDKDMEDYAKQVKESWENKISMFLEENSYDRITLHQMIRLIREGKSLSFDKNA